MKSAYGYIIVNGNTEELDWDGELHPTVESAIESLTAQCTGYARTEKGAADSDREVWWSNYNIHPVGERIKVGESERPGCVGDPAVTLDAPEGIPAAFVEKARQAVDWERHEYRVNRAGSPADWVPYCQCGWKADHPFDVASYDRHIATLVLEAVYADIKAEALREAAVELAGLRAKNYAENPQAVGNATYREGIQRAEMLLNRRADRLAGGETK